MLLTNVEMRLSGDMPEQLVSVESDTFAFFPEFKIDFCSTAMFWQTWQKFVEWIALRADFLLWTLLSKCAKGQRAGWIVTLIIHMVMKTLLQLSSMTILCPKLWMGFLNRFNPWCRAKILIVKLWSSKLSILANSSQIDSADHCFIPSLNGNRSRAIATVKAQYSIDMDAIYSWKWMCSLSCKYNFCRVIKSVARSHSWLFIVITWHKSMSKVAREKKLVGIKSPIILNSYMRLPSWMKTILDRLEVW